MLLVLGFGYGCFVCLLRYALVVCDWWVDWPGSGVLVMWVVAGGFGCCDWWGCCVCYCWWF